MAQISETSGRIFDGKVLKRLMTFAKPYRWRFILIIVLTLSMGILAPWRVELIGQTVDNYIAIGDLEGTLYMTILMLVVLIINSIAQYVHTFTSGWLGQTIIRDIRVKLYEHILHLRLRFFDTNQVGRLITRNISDVETLSDVFTDGLAAMAGDVLQLVFILGFMFYADWKLTLVSMSAFPLLLLSTYVFKEKIKETFNDARVAVANLNTFVQEHITGMTIVQLFGAEKREYQRFNAINDEHRKANIRSVWYYSIYFPVAEVIGAAGTGLLVWYGAKGVLEDTVSLGTLISFIMYIQMFFRPIRAIADRFNTLQLGIVSSERIMNLLDNTEYIVNDGKFTPAKVNGDVAFNNVWFAYDEENFVLKNISFKVEAGKTLALVGATGAGKSSVINLLNRLYEIQKGEILVDNADIKTYELGYLRKHIGVVLQDVFLFGGSIRDNITLGNTEITDAQIIDAAEQIGAMHFINNLPGKLDYPVMERGATLSVGQRQMISFIRALVFDPAIIVLDEATSSVDTETEEMIQAAIERMMQGRTSIVIAHRLSTIQKADQILVMDKGEIKEQGNHPQLLEQGGLYAQLHKMQYKEVL
jgi:ATP-binding cassette subfamily B protein